jgi:hypothetical protein
MVLSIVSSLVPIVVDDASTTSTGPVSPVPGRGVVTPARVALLVKLSPVAVGSPPP